MHGSRSANMTATGREKLVRHKHPGVEVQDVGHALWPWPPFSEGSGPPRRPPQGAAVHPRDGDEWEGQRVLEAGHRPAGGRLQGVAHAMVVNTHDYTRMFMPRDASADAWHVHPAYHKALVACITAYWLFCNTIILVFSI